ncbi:signal recognition particle SRP9/SRP14 subunit [Marasmius fiardii PR-910]|nr:signal recognition particle SRP9/SRP14 subunit [Marasmius fiardii PR-910]
MVYIQSWQEFQDAAEALYQKSPNKARYCIKWRSCEGRLVLKITDDVTCLKFKTYSSLYLNRFEALNLSLMEKMQNRRVVEVPAQETTSSKDAPPSSTGGITSATPTPSASTSGGVKKKKPAKKKPRT